MGYSQVRLVTQQEQQDATQEETAHPEPTGERRLESDQGPVGRTYDHNGSQQEGVGVLASALPQTGGDRLITNAT